MSKWEDWSLGKKILAIVGGSIAGAGFAILFGFALMWLWNSLMPGIFGLPRISYWQGWGLLILSSILFKASPSGGGNHGDRRRKKMIRDRMRQDGDGESQDIGEERGK